MIICRVTLKTDGRFLQHKLRAVAVSGGANIEIVLLRRVVKSSARECRHVPKAILRGAVLGAHRANAEGEVLQDAARRVHRLCLRVVGHDVGNGRRVRVAAHKTELQTFIADEERHRLHGRGADGISEPIGERRPEHFGRLLRVAESALAVL